MGWVITASRAGMQGMFNFFAARWNNISGTRGGGQGDRRAVEVGRSVASALALVAVVAGRAAVMRDGKVCHAVGHHHHAEFLSNHFARPYPTTRKTHGRKEFAVGH